MDTPLLTIAEAAEKIGRSHSTVRRLIRTIADGSGHPDRAGIEPTPKAVEAFKKKGENFTWMVREDVLMKHLQSAPLEDKKLRSDTTSHLKDDVFQILRKELEIKNQQIEKQWDVINSLNERLREGNILMGSLQQRLALPEPQSPPLNAFTTPSAEPSVDPVKRAVKKKVMEAKEAVSKKSGIRQPEADEASMTASVKTPVKASKRGLFGWLKNI